MMKILMHPDTTIRLRIWNRIRHVLWAEKGEAGDETKKKHFGRNRGLRGLL